MNILGITNFYSSIDPLSPQAIQKPMQIISGQGFTIQIISPIPFSNRILSKKWSTVSKIPKRRKVENVEVFHPYYLEFPKNFSKRTAAFRYYIGIKQLISRNEIFFKPDLIHSHMCYPDGYAALRLSSRWRVPFIITVRGSDLLTIKNFPQVKKKYDEILTKSSKVILPSFRIAEQFSDFYLDTLDAKIEVIPNGIEPSEFSDLKAVEFPYLKGKKVIVSVSNLYKDKGIDINLRALSVLVKQHKDIHYLIIGDGQERANLVKLMTDLKLEEYVTFVGRVNHHSALEYIKSCDIFSLPGWNETFGLVYLEAMYLKKPIVATFNDGIDGTAIDGIHGFLTHKQNVNEVVNALNKLLCSEKLRTEMGTQGFQQVFSRYTWEKHAEKISKIYQEIKNGTKRI